MNNIHLSKTYKNLINIINEELITKSIDGITVSDICKKAHIHRTTFYSYFSDKYELLDASLNYRLDNILQEIVNNNKFSSSKEFYRVIIQRLVDGIYENHSFYKNLVFRNGQELMNAFEKALSNKTEEVITMNNEFPNISHDVVGKFYSGAIISVLINWVKNDCKMEKSELIKCFMELL